MEVNGNVVALSGGRHWFQRTVRRLASDSGNVVVVDHARQRMALRDIALDEVLRVLRCGKCKEDPQPGHGDDWKVKVVGSANGREIVVVAAVKAHQACKLVVVTVWLAGDNEGEGGV